eukprot:13663910-Alexandrium_andersonii.AAC.1
MTLAGLTAPAPRWHWSKLTTLMPGRSESRIVEGSRRPWSGMARGSRWRTRPGGCGAGTQARGSGAR